LSRDATTRSFEDGDSAVFNVDRTIGSAVGFAVGWAAAFTLVVRIAIIVPTDR